MNRILFNIILMAAGVSSILLHADVVSDAEEALSKAREAMRVYDFSAARSYYAKYVSLMDKAGLDSSIGSEGIRSADAGRDMLERVEQIVVIDRIDTPLATFLHEIPLSTQAGKLFYAEADSMPGFVSADSRLRYTTMAQGDSLPARIFEQTRLLSGRYDEPQPIMDDDEDALFPFMMPDGCTFYFSSTRPGGLGGLDLYRSNRDNEDGSFMGAVNMGMPYNSPANDYLLAIDEYTGVGWLVTDRNYDDQEQMVSIYVFVPSEVRHNYDPDTEDIISLARIDDIDATLPEDSDYDSLLDAIDALREARPAPRATLSFTMPDGRVLTNFDAATRADVADYQSAVSALGQAEDELLALRADYARNHSQAVAKDILALESRVEKQREQLRRQKQQLITTLKDAR